MCALICVALTIPSDHWGLAVPHDNFPRHLHLECGFNDEGFQHRNQMVCVAMRMLFVAFEIAERLAWCGRPPVGVGRGGSSISDP